LVGFAPFDAAGDCLQSPRAERPSGYEPNGLYYNSLKQLNSISGNVNGEEVNFGLYIKLNMETGEEFAAVTNMAPQMGAIMRQVTAMVTIGGATSGDIKNLFDLSNGNYVNYATLFWPNTNDVPLAL